MFNTVAMSSSGDLQREWLQALADQRNLTFSAMARKAGLTASTLTRLMNQDNVRALGGTTIDKICAAFGIAPPGVDHFEEDAKPFGGPDPRQLMRMALDSPATDLWRVSNDALEMAGYQIGDFLVVDMNARPVAGDVVIAQRYHFTEGRAETILRIYEPPYLVAASTRPEYRKPILAEDSAIAIKGVVVGSYRRNRMAGGGNTAA